MVWIRALSDMNEDSERPDLFLGYYSAPPPTFLFAPDNVMFSTEISSTFDAIKPLLKQPYGRRISYSWQFHMT